MKIKFVSFPRSEAYKGEQQETMMVAEDSGKYGEREIFYD